MSNVELYVHSSFGRDKQPPEWFKGRRARWQRRKTDDITALVLHQTDVRGQFGPADFAGLAKRLAGTGEDRRGVPTFPPKSLRSKSPARASRSRASTWPP